MFKALLALFLASTASAQMGLLVQNEPSPNGTAITPTSVVASSYAVIGPVMITGNAGGSTVLTIGNTGVSQANFTNAAIYQTAAGATTLNSVSGQVLDLSIGGTMSARLSSAGNLGLGGAAPGTNFRLDVKGETATSAKWAARFRDSNDDSLLTVRNDGVIDGAKQQRARLTGARPVPASTWYPIFWSTEVTDIGNILDTGISSRTLTGLAVGAWEVECNVALPLEGVGGVNSYIGIASDGATCSTFLARTRRTSVANLVNELSVTYRGEIATNDTITCCVNTPTAVSPDSNTYHTNMTARKIW